jgi:hypothetical protein
VAEIPAKNNNIRRSILRTLILTNRAHPYLDVLSEIGIAHTDIAKHLGIDRSTMAGYTSGKRRLPNKHIKNLIPLMKEVEKELESVLKHHSPEGRRIAFKFDVDVLDISEKEKKSREERFVRNYTKLGENLKLLKQLMLSK